MYNRLSHKLHERHASSVVIHQTFVGDVSARDSMSEIMSGLSGVLLEMDSSYFDIRQNAARDKRILVLADLIALWDVRIEIVFAIPFGKVRNRAPDSMAYFQDALYRLMIEHWQCPGMSHADRADVDIRSRLVWVVLTSTKHL
jgi:hypothetical protein